jgi:hypothetical protein
MSRPRLDYGSSLVLTISRQPRQLATAVRVGKTVPPGLLSAIVAMAALGLAITIGTKLVLSSS